MTKPRGKHLLRQGPSTDARPGSELSFAQCFRCGKCCQTANLDANEPGSLSPVRAFAGHDNPQRLGHKTAQVQESGEAARWNPSHRKRIISFRLANSLVLKIYGRSVVVSNGSHSWQSLCSGGTASQAVLLNGTAQSSASLFIIFDLFWFASQSIKSACRRCRTR
jgi:hypothetical protein